MPWLRVGDSRRVKGNTVRLKFKLAVGPLAGVMAMAPW